MADCSSRRPLPGGWAGGALSQRVAVVLAVVMSAGGGVGCRGVGGSDPDSGVDGDADRDGGVDGGGDGGGDGGRDARADGSEDADPPGPDGGEPDGSGDGGPRGLTSTLAITCDGELSGRAVVNWNTNLGIAFTDPGSPYGFRGSISFELPSGFSGAIDNPEDYDPGGPRHTVAVTDRSYGTYGNHCWEAGTPAQGGRGFVERWDPSSGIVRATFEDFPLQECVSRSGPCVLSGTIETTGEGVFDE